MYQVISCLIVLSLVGCSRHAYEPSVLNNGQIDKKNLMEIAEIDENIIEYAQDVYLTEPEEMTEDYVLPGSELELIEHFNHDTDFANFVDTHFLTTYCDSRGGTVLNWKIAKEHERLRGVGIKREFYTCEVNSKVESALLYDIKKKGPFVKIEKKYLTDQEFEKYQTYYKQYTSSDGTIAIDKSSLYDPENGFHYKSYSHPVFIHLKNTDSEKTSHDINNISILLGDKEIDTSTYDRETRQKDSCKKVVLSPGETHKEEIVVKTTGLKKIRPKDIYNITFVIDGQTYSNFEETDPYHREKIPLEQSQEILAFQ